MSIKIKRKKLGGIKMYRLISSMDDKLLHDAEYITLKEAKNILIQQEIFKFKKNVIGIVREFPMFDYANGKRVEPKNPETYETYDLYVLKNYYIPGGTEKLESDFKSVVNEYDLNLNEKNKFGLYSINGVLHKNKPHLLAISDSEEKLKEYCKNKFGQIANPDNFFGDETIYIIKEHDLTIL